MKPPTFLHFICLVFWSWGILSSPSHAQEVLNYNFDRGIDDRYNMYIYKASDGYVWVSSSSKGAYRFNGLAFEQFPRGRTINLNIQSNFYEASNRDIWFASEHQLHQYQAEVDKVFSRFVKDGSDKQLSGPRPFYLDTLRNELWLRADGRLGILDLNQPDSAIQFLSTDTTMGYGFTVRIDTANQVQSIYAYPWLYQPGFEIWSRKREDQWSKKNIPYLKDQEQDSLPHITKILIEDEQKLWLMSAEGLLSYHLTAPQKSQRILHPKISEYYCNGGTFYDTNQIWISTRRNGILQYDPINDAFLPTAFTDEVLTDASLFDLLIDDEETLWLGQTKKGIYQSDHSQRNFRHPFDALNLGPKISFLLEDQEENIWAASQSEGLFIFNQEGELIEKYPFDQGFIPSKSLHHMSMDREGRIWCMSEKRIYRFEDKRWHWIHEQQQNERLLSILHHSSGQHFVSTSGGIRLFDEKASGRERMGWAKDFRDHKQLHSVQLYESQNGLTLVPRINQKLEVYRNSADKLIYENEIPIEADFFHFSENKNGDTLWVGTSQGLLYVDLKRYSYGFLFSDPLALGKRIVYGAVSDEQGHLWVSGSEGLFHIKDKMLYQFPAENGLNSDRFSEKARLFSADQKVWMGTDRGLIVFDPKETNAWPYLPKLHLEQVWIDQDSVPYRINVEKIQNLNLAYYAKDLALKVVAVGNYLPELSTIQYRWDPAEQWKEIKNGEILEFSAKHLPKGKSQLELRAANANRGPFTPSLIIPIFKRVPIWENAWFWLILAVIAISGTYLGSFLYTKNRFKRQLEAQEQLFKERLRIAEDLHDDIGSSLKSVHILSILAKQKVEDPDHPILPIIDRMEEEIQSSSNSLSEIIWNINTQDRSLSDFFATIRRTASEVFEANDIDGEVLFPKNLDQLQLDIDKQRQLFLFFKEAINNIAKHAQCSKAHIEIIRQTEGLYIQISDNGIGFNQDHVQHKGNGLRNMTERMVSKLNGELTISTLPDNGTLLTAKLPITENGD
ncbi:MAG: ATP-binding protein [Bacteroidota bacterium]